MPAPVCVPVLPPNRGAGWSPRLRTRLQVRHVGCFNTMAKVTPDVRAVWSGFCSPLLKQTVLQIEGVRVLLIRQRFLSQMAALGVENWRIDCVPLEPATSSHPRCMTAWTSRSMRSLTLERRRRAGVVHGVPVVAFASTHAHNVGKSLMTLSVERIRSRERNEYVRIASTLGNDVERFVAFARICEGVAIAVVRRQGLRWRWNPSTAIVEMVRQVGEKNECRRERRRVGRRGALSAEDSKGESTVRAILQTLRKAAPTLRASSRRDS